MSDRSERGPDGRLSSLTAAPTDLDTRIVGVTIAAVTRVGTQLVASGQVASDGTSLVATGLVGADVDLPQAQRAAWVCARNVLEALRVEAGSLDRVRAVRITVFVASAPGFTQQHLVAHGASAAVLEVLGPDRGRHGRAAIGVAGLPLGSAVEVDGVFELGGIPQGAAS